MYFPKQQTISDLLQPKTYILDLLVHLEQLFYICFVISAVLIGQQIKHDSTFI